MSILNPWGALRRERLNAANLSSDLIEARGNEHRLSIAAGGYQGALRSIVATATAVNSPNGTTRKILRIAENAL